MHLDDIVHRLLPIVGPLAFLVAVTRLHRCTHSFALLLCALALGFTMVACAISAWLGLQFEQSHELPDWYGRLYWWSTQWASPLGYAVAGFSLLVFSMRNAISRRGA